MNDQLPPTYYLYNVGLPLLFFFAMFAIAVYRQPQNWLRLIIVYVAIAVVAGIFVYTVMPIVLWISDRLGV